MLSVWNSSHWLLVLTTFERKGFIKGVCFSTALTNCINMKVGWNNDRCLKFISCCLTTLGGRGVVKDVCYLPTWINWTNISWIPVVVGCDHIWGSYSKYSIVQLLLYPIEVLRKDMIKKVYTSKKSEDECWKLIMTDINEKSTYMNCTK